MTFYELLVKAFHGKSVGVYDVEYEDSLGNIAHMDVTKTTQGIVEGDVPMDQWPTAKIYSFEKHRFKKALRKIKEEPATGNKLVTMAIERGSYNSWTKRQLDKSSLEED